MSKHAEFLIDGIPAKEYFSDLESRLANLEKHTTRQSILLTIIGITQIITGINLLVGV